MKWFRGRFKYAFSGLRYAICDKSIALQMLFGLLVILVGLLLGFTVQEWFWILLCIVLVVVGEIINSCIEQLVDYISLEHTKQAKQIKDMAAGAVFLLSLFSAFIGFVILIQKII
ncbi:diacylglycerol kinase family protein [Faecalicoccus pleomorphus]|uniref:diacylglycerol kinase family protein n=1 Tax=Faecalicoccus pleomorphus TaxID=1323 RepID=UPI0026EB6C2D|nr:diacylglycerol kinase family protein [Faecalicoccus pleomorphus]